MAGVGVGVWGSYYHRELEDVIVYFGQLLETTWMSRSYAELALFLTGCSAHC